MAYLLGTIVLIILLLFIFKTKKNINVLKIEVNELKKKSDQK
ncbi:hypothetical protein [Clostridium botulinum]|nr:hypothetical protein [Clostridium botulinum]